MPPYEDNPGPLPAADLCNRFSENPIKGKGPLGNEFKQQMYYSGDKKTLVEHAQKMLLALAKAKDKPEYSVGSKGADGIFGNDTENAVINFQKDHTSWEGTPLLQDGLIGPRTSDALNRALVCIWYDAYQTPPELSGKAGKLAFLTITRELLVREGASIEIPEGAESAIVSLGDCPGEDKILGIDLTQSPKDWCPNACNGRIAFTARIYECKDGQWVFPGSKRKITFQLEKVSRHPGICMNFPPTKEVKKNAQDTYTGPFANTNPDLFFADDESRNAEFDFDDDSTDTDSTKTCPQTILSEGDNPTHQHHYQKATTKKAVNEATIWIRCEDFGAVGYLKATASDCDSLKPREIDGAVSGEKGENTVKIPWDENGNDIADVADQDKFNGVPAIAIEDNDADPAGDGTLGDGLTNFEEYRGFIVADVQMVGSALQKGTAKKHVRTSLTKKTIFIHDRDNLTTGLFGVSGLEVYLLPDGSYYNGDSADHGDDKGPDPGTQIINFNKVEAYWKGDQHGLRLVDEAMPGFRGFACGEWKTKYDDTPQNQYCPQYINRVLVNRALVVAEENPADPTKAIPGLLACTIAHELGHAVHLHHHGPGGGTGMFCTNAVHPNQNQYNPIHGAASGEVDCIMRYHNVFLFWCHDHGTGSGQVSSHTAHPIPSPEGVGTRFCSAQTATGCNIAGNCQNTTNEGNCQGQFKVKDWK